MNKFAFGTTLLILFTALASAQQKSELVYVGGSAVNGFSVNPTTGVLTAVPGSPFAAEAQEGLAISPAGNFLFTAQNPGITAATINPTTGALTSVPGSPFAASLYFGALVVSPSGEYLYAASSTFIYTFTIDGNVGAITPIGSPVSLNGLQATSFAMTPGGELLYAGTAENLLGFTVNPKNGTLTTIPMDVAGTSPVISPSGYLYAIYGLLGGFGTEIGAYSINTSSGQLTPVTGSPFTAVNTGVFLLALDRKGKFLYQVAGAPAYAVAGFSLNSTTGAISGQVPGSPFATAAGFPVGLLVDRSGRFVYTSNGGATDISGFNLNGTTGSLSTISGLLLGTSANPFTIVDTVPQPVSTATLKALAIKPVNPTVDSASTFTEQFFAVGEYSDGTQRFLTASVTWKSMSPNVASIGNTPGEQGLATILSKGSTQIMATLNGKTATTILTVQ